LANSFHPSGPGWGTLGLLRWMVQSTCKPLSLSYFGNRRCTGVKEGALQDSPEEYSAGTLKGNITHRILRNLKTFQFSAGARLTRQKQRCSIRKIQGSLRTSCLFQRYFGLSEGPALQLRLWYNYDCGIHPLSYLIYNNLRVIQVGLEKV
jgi:hypothetical protein